LRAGAAVTIVRAMGWPDRKPFDVVRAWEGSHLAARAQLL
jgi:hypothetical protein